MLSCAILRSFGRLFGLLSILPFPTHLLVVRIEYGCSRIDAAWPTCVGVVFGKWSLLGRRSYQIVHSLLMRSIFRGSFVSRLVSGFGTTKIATCGRLSSHKIANEGKCPMQTKWEL